VDIDPSKTLYDLRGLHFYDKKSEVDDQDGHTVTYDDGFGNVDVLKTTADSKLISDEFSSVNRTHDVVRPDGSGGYTLEEEINGVLQLQQQVHAASDSLLKFYNNNATANNTKPYREADIAVDNNGKVTNVTVFDTTQTAAAVAQIFGSALGRALVPGNNQLGQAAVGVLAGTVAGAIGARLAQAFSAEGGFAANGSLVFDASINDILSGENLVPSGAGAVASLLTAELGTPLNLTGFGAQMFNAAVGGYTGSILSTITKPGGVGLAGFASNTIWTDALKNAGTAVSGALGRFLADEVYPADSHAAQIGGELAGALGSYVGLVVGNIIGGVLNFVIPGIGAFFGTVFGRIFADAFFDAERHPGAMHAVRSYGYDYSTELSGVVDDGNTGVSKKMADAVKDIVNGYLHDVNGAALAYSSQKMVGYLTNGTPYLYQEGWFPAVSDPSAHFSKAEDAVAAAAHDLLRNTEVIGGDLLVKRAHTAFVQTMHPDIDGRVAYEQSDFDALVAQNYLDLTALGSDLRIAQDYEQYLNNREVINALIAQYPDSAFTAGWAATFARVSDLGLNHVNASDFLGGLVGFLDSVQKAGLGFNAAGVSFNQTGNTAVIDIKVPNGSNVPGALSAFADQVNQSSDATGTTLQFVINNGMVPLGFHGPSSATLASGEWTVNGSLGNNIWFGTDNAASTFNATGGGNDILIGGATDEHINAGEGWNFVDGGAGGDTITSGSGNDILHGGPGHDYLAGGGGNDSYTFNRGDGADTVEDIGGADTLALGPGIGLTDISLQGNGNDLTVAVKDPAHPNTPFAQLADRILLKNWAVPADQIETLSFADGATLNLANVFATLRVPFGAALSHNAVAENSANGTVVGTVTGFDLDSDPVLRYTFADNADAGGRFAIDASTGVVTVANGALLDYESWTSHQIKVRTADPAGHFFDQPFTIGVTDVYERVIEASGSTSLTQVANNFYLTSGGSGPSLKASGVAVVAGQFGALAPIGAEQIAGGYEVAWKNSAADQYTVWTTDLNGNYLSNPTGALSGTSIALKLLEPGFHQDLNGDGRIGVVTTVIEAAGSTSLTRLDDNFCLYSGGSGPSLKFSGADVLAGQFGGFAPIGAEQIAGGYEVAWKISGADQYTVWTTDVNGNYITNIIGVVSGASIALKSLEASFHQDLNGDGVIAFYSDAAANNFAGGPGADTVSYANSATGVIVDLVHQLSWDGHVTDTMSGIENAENSLGAKQYCRSHFGVHVSPFRMQLQAGRLKRWPRLLSLPARFRQAAGSRHSKEGYSPPFGRH
jgi:20S proteasome alpha/beta subunit